MTFSIPRSSHIVDTAANVEEQLWQGSSLG